MNQSLTQGKSIIKKLFLAFIILLSTNSLFAQLHFTSNFREEWGYNTVTKEKTLIERKEMTTSIISSKDGVFRFTPAYKLLVGCSLETELEKDKNGTLVANVQGTDGFKYLLKISEGNIILVRAQAVNNKLTILKYGITKAWVKE